MSVKHSIWKVGEKPIPLPASTLKDEDTLENMIAVDPSILAEEWLIIGRQVQTKFNGYVDLLAIAPDGSLVVIELKRHKTPRDVVAQAIDYASWVVSLEADEVTAIYAKYRPGENLRDAFAKRFKQELLDENLNESHQIVVVAAELDASTERIVKYLSDRQLAINVLFFEVFANGDDQFLIRRWLVDPAITQGDVAAVSKNKEPWNGEFYVSFGEGSTRSWAEARKHGFISAGGGAWYSRTLNLLKVGDRIWVRVPKLGYVGVGKVTATAVPTKEFILRVDGKDLNILDVVTDRDYGRNSDEDNQEYFVKVEWLATTALEDAYDELGFFGNRNSVCKPTVIRWRSTVDKLKIHFKIS